MGYKSQKLEIREQRVFSESLKKQIVKDLVNKRTSIRQVKLEHQVSATSVYRWLYRYSPVHDRKRTLVVQKENEDIYSKN